MARRPAEKVPLNLTEVILAQGSSTESRADLAMRAAHLQSAILSVLLLILGFQTLQWGIMADLIASNRKLLEDLLYRVRAMELQEKR